VNRRAGRAAAAGLAAWACSLFLAAPNLRIYAHPETYHQRYDLFVRQVANPFVRAGGEWDGDFMGYRILVPLLSHVAGVPAWAGLGLIWLAGLATLGLVFWWLERHTSRRTAWLATMGLAMTPLVQSSHIYLGYADSVGWLIVMALIVWPSPAAWAIGTVAMLFNDERGIIALPFALAVVVFEKRHDWPAVVRAGVPLGTAVVAGVIVALAGRLAIASGLIGGAPLADGILPIGAGFDRLYLAHVAGLILALKAFWVLVAWAAAVAWREDEARRYWILLALYVLVAVAVSARVFDFWRSLAALFPGALLALRLLHIDRARRLGRVLPVLTLLMIAMPQLEQMNQAIRWLRPLPVAVYEWRADVSVADSLRRSLPR
jgi:hypothetical protein